MKQTLRTLAFSEKQLATSDGRWFTVRIMPYAPWPMSSRAWWSPSWNFNFALASSPETAADALALRHELQVHQVELEWQAQALRDSRADLESSLRRQVELCDGQPFGCFTIDARLPVHELNQTGAAMLVIERVTSVA